MKFGFIGNANNYPLMLARALKRLGHDVLFIVTHDQNTPLDRPENKYPDSFPYPDWIIDLSPIDLWNHEVINPRKQNAVRLLQSCDVVMLNQYYVCLEPEILKPCVVLLTGTDLFTCAPQKHVNEMVESSSSYEPFTLNYSVTRKFYQARVNAQRFGIRNAVMLNFFPKGTYLEADRLMDEIGANDAKRTYFQMTDTEQINYCRPQENKTLRLFCATRLTWDKMADPALTVLDYKGSDVMIKGLSLFAKECPVLDIHLVKKGAHVDQLIKLAETEGLSKFITWHDEMTQTEVQNQFELADIVLEQFAESFIGMAGLDALATGRPLIANDYFRIFSRSATDRSPIYQATTPEEVVQQLRILSKHEARVKSGQYSRHYVEKHFSADSAAAFITEYLDQYFSKNTYTIEPKLKFAEQQHKLLTGKYLTEDDLPVENRNDIHGDFKDYFDFILEQATDLESRFFAAGDYLFPQKLAEKIKIILNYGEARKYEEAICLVDQLLNQDPDTYDIHNLKAEILMLKGDFPEAEEILTNLLIKYPADIETLNNLAFLKMTVGAYAEAFKCIKDVLLLDPNNKTAQNIMMNVKKAIAEHNNNMRSEHSAGGKQ